MWADVTRTFPPRVGTRLSPRELDVLELAAQGLMDKQIAARLGIADQTVKNNLTHAYLRLGVHSRVQAFRKLGWLA